MQKFDNQPVMGWWFKELGGGGGHWKKESAVGVLVKYYTVYVKVRESTFCFRTILSGLVSQISIVYKRPYLLPCASDALRSVLLTQSGFTCNHGQS